jgi:hypothetical protein
MTGSIDADKPDSSGPARDGAIDLGQRRRAQLERALALLGEAVAILDQERLSKAAAYVDMAQNLVTHEVPHGV